MKKTTTKSLSASIMRMAAVCLFMLTGSLSASAANGDRFNCKDLIVTPTDSYWARLEVVSEADATVKIISREDEGEGFVNTLAKLSSNGMYPVTKDLDYFQLYDCEFANNCFFYDSDKGCICDERFYGDPVYQDVVEIVRTGTATSIEESVSSTPNTQHPSPIYDLQGRRVNGKPQPGIVIQDGKKVVIE